MKRFFLFLTSLLTIMPGFLSISIASAIENPETEYWTLKDMESLSAESLNEVNELCDIEDRGCRNQYLRERRERGNIYRLLESFESRKLIITAVNPDSNKIRVVYYNELKRKKLLGQIEEPAELVHLYIGRVEYEDHNRSPWHEMISIAEGSEDYPDTHITFSWEASDENHTEFLPNVEQEFDMADDALLEGVRNVFYYELKDTSNNGGRDVYRLTNCLADYQPGTECQIRFSSEGEILYIPVGIEAPTEQTGEGDESNENNSEDTNDGGEDTYSGDDEESHEALSPDEEPLNDSAELDNEIVDNTEETLVEMDTGEEIEENHGVKEEGIEEKPDVKEEIEEEITEIISEKESEELIASESKESGFGEEDAKEPLPALMPEPESKIQLIGSIISPKQIQPKLEVSIKPILAPDTGQNMAPDEQGNAEAEVIDLPWVIGLSIASLLFIAWWFIPVSKKRRQ